MPFGKDFKFVTQLALLIFLLGLAVAVWQVLLDHYGFWAIAIFFGGCVLWLALMLWLDWNSDRVPGVCRFCGCTEAAPCEPGCDWADKSRTCCTAPLCQTRKAAGQ